jgi:hypothetical protein
MLTCSTHCGVTALLPVATSLLMHRIVFVQQCVHQTNPHDFAITDTLLQLQVATLAAAAA